MPDSPLDARLSGVLGGRTATAFGKAFGLRTVGDLLSHYPRRYARRGELTALNDLPLDENVTIVAEVLEVTERTMRARKGAILEVTISDGTGILTLTFFNQAWRKKELHRGARGIFAGKVTLYRGLRQLAHPDYQLFEPTADARGGVDTVGSRSAASWAEQPIPIYPASGSVSSWQLQQAIAVVLDTLGEVTDPVPMEVRATRGLMSFSRAL